VVASIDACLDHFMRSVGAARHTDIVLDSIQRVKVVFLLPERPDEPCIELVEPVGEKSPVLRFLEQGGGLHHVCYEVADITRQLAHMLTVGATVIRRPRPALAFDNRQIAWVVTAEKLLIEYLEMAHGGAG
jgi:methylmalonyl-CoA/ethylmalonyl-CoA epimerase